MMKMPSISLFDKNAAYRKTIMKVSLFVLLAVLSCSRQPSYPSAPQQGLDIVIDESVLEPDTPKFYNYHYKGKSINYFVLKIDNKVSSFLDACASCYTHKKGYRYDNGAVTCRYCSMKFSVFKLEKGIGGCYPIKMDSRTEKGRHHIRITTLKAAADKF
jgi:uncharacterized membrane protein